MGKSELVAAIAEKTGMKKKDVTAAVEAFTAVVSEELATGGKVQLCIFQHPRVLSLKQARLLRLLLISNHS